ncbi:type II secretion system protein [Dasania marina]|uniref:type II secretion system protein n=1 Tax=Dasania marina TaxID=471499 RepID=UPI0003698805|nr:type II secretion system protein [Dasania marina]
MKQQQSGFTLIELVAVIVLLGILAVTALPRFINLQADAKEATLQGIKGAIQGADTQIFARALLDSKTSGVAQIDSDADGTLDIYVTNGHINAYSLGLGTPTAVDIDGEGFLLGGAWTTDTTMAAAPPTTAGGVTVYMGYSATCRLEFTEATAATDIPDVVVTKSNCN